MKVLFGGDLSFAWSPPQSFGEKLRGVFSPLDKEDRALFQRLNEDSGYTGMKAAAERSRIISESRHLSSGIAGSTANIDFFCVNLECALSSRGTPLKEKRFKLKASPHHFYSLKKLGVNAVCLANNHILDFGPEGLSDTTALLDKIGIPYCGLRHNRERYQKPLVLERDNEKIAILNFVDPSIIDPDPELFMKHDPCPFPLVPDDVLENIADVSKDMPVVAVLHWGEEWSFLESDSMKSFARLCIDRGASAVIGHHTHLVGGIEEYRDRPIFYGLGNLFMSLPAFSSRRASRRIMARLEFDRGELKKYEAIPLVSDGENFPQVSPAFKVESLRNGYLPKAVHDTEKILFDSYRTLNSASVSSGTDDTNQPFSWHDDYRNLFEVIQGKLPVGPGWRRAKEIWQGLALSRELMGDEYLLMNIFHGSDDSEVLVKFDIPQKLDSLKLILGYPDWFHPRDEFVMASFTLSIDDKPLFELNSELPAKSWRIETITPEFPLTEGHRLALSFRGVKGKFSYLAWRLLGFR